jgi:hypothetical protein
MPRPERNPKTGDRQNTQEVGPWNGAKLVQISGEDDYRAKNGDILCHYRCRWLRAESPLRLRQDGPGMGAPTLGHSAVRG